GRVDRDFLGARVQDFLRVGHGTNTPGNAEGDVQDAGYATHPLTVDRATFGARSDVIEDELVRALVAIARRELHDVAYDLVVAEADAFYDLAFADVEAGDDASGKNGRSSSGFMRSSSNALPLTAAATPIWARASRSAALRTPPEACQDRPGKRDI